MPLIILEAVDYCVGQFSFSSERPLTFFFKLRNRLPTRFCIWQRTLTFPLQSFYKHLWQLDSFYYHHLLNTDNNATWKNFFCACYFHCTGWTRIVHSTFVFLFPVVKSKFVCFCRGPFDLQPLQYLLITWISTILPVSNEMLVKLPLSEANPRRCQEPSHEMGISTILSAGVLWEIWFLWLLLSLFVQLYSQHV